MPTRKARRWARSDYAGDSPSLAQRLIGSTLVRVLDDGERLSGVIVETEAYLGPRDKAAHSFGGRRTPRNEAMYARAGTAYVYFTYGMHHCVNIVCGEVGEPVAVLIRALEPVEGVERMRALRSGRRAVTRDRDLCSGPGKLCQALSIDRSLNGEDLVTSRRLWVEGGAGPGAITLGNGPRVGVGYAEEWAAARLRWWAAGNGHVSGRTGGRV